ncbi:hypothetical protein MNB_SM-3-729 [hydrothermal vent metagenome]|uniref:Inner membrane protein YgaP-like transmembrane domain-containing protein n=1 Tax=hydrothermal vent metagenome TaxID=652676 RepID=A0A1W1D421_9ZZZZ
MDFNKVRKICRIVRIIVGLVLIGVGVVTQNFWFFLGIIPLIAGITNFCPICIFTDKCELPQNDKES